MRLNEDLKLILYVDQTYQIHDHDLVGIDKLWYIYFHSADQKVIKKCKEFLWKLSTYSKIPEVSQKLYENYVKNIIYYMVNCDPEYKIDLCNKGFDIIDKMNEVGLKKEVLPSKNIEIHLKN